MRLALISEHASPLAALGGTDAGGQNVYVAQTGSLLARSGHTVDVYTRRTSTEQPETVTLRPGLRVVHVSAGPPDDIPKEDLLGYMPAFADEVAARMRREGPADLVHAHFWMSGLVALALKKRLGVPFVVTFHALGRVRRKHQGDADRFPEERFAAEEAIVSAAERIVAECPQDASDLISLYSADPDRLVQIPCGFDPTEMEPLDKGLARELLGIDRATQVVLQLGRMVPRKGVDDAIRGFARATAGRDDAMMVVVGGEVSDESVTETAEGARLLEVAREERADGRIRFVGSKSRDSLRYFYSASDVFVSVPWYEPFGITPLEAMGCGVPVVGSEVGGIKFTVEDGVTGLLVPPKDPDAIAGAIGRLLHEPRLRDRLGRAGRDRVCRGFTWEHVARALDRMYGSVVRPAPVLDLSRLRESATLAETARQLTAHVQAIENDAARAARLIADTAMAGGTVLICGNGGSAADAEHFAGELVGRFSLEREAVPAVALTSDAAIVTAIGNDYGFEQVFARQVEAFGEPGDLLLAISTSGRSPNVLRALEAARSRGVRTVGLLGRDGGPARRLCDVAVVVPTNVTARIQEVHQLVIHHFAAAVDDAYATMLATSDVGMATSFSQGYLA